MKDVPRVLRYLRPYWKLAMASVVLAVLTALVTLLLPWPLKILVDNVVAEQVRDSIPVAWLGERTIKGFSRAMRVFAVAAGDTPRRTPNAICGNRLQPGTQPPERGDPADCPVALDRFSMDCFLH